MGSNFLLRHMGSHSECTEKCNIKAVVSISGAFDMAATVADMRKPAFGLIDAYVLKKFKSVCSQHRFLVQNEEPSFFKDGI